MNRSGAGTLGIFNFTKSTYTGQLARELPLIYRRRCRNGVRHDRIQTYQPNQYVTPDSARCHPDRFWFGAWPGMEI